MVNTFLWSSVFRPNSTYFHSSVPKIFMIRIGWTNYIYETPNGFSQWGFFRKKWNSFYLTKGEVGSTPVNIILTLSTTFKNWIFRWSSFGPKSTYADSWNDKTFTDCLGWTNDIPETPNGFSHWGFFRRRWEHFLKFSFFSSHFLLKFSRNFSLSDLAKNTVQMRHFDQICEKIRFWKIRFQVGSNQDTLWIQMKWTRESWKVPRMPSELKPMLRV